MKQLIDILWYKLAMWRAAAPASAARVPLKSIFSFIVYAAFAVGAVFFSRFVAWYLLEYVRIGLFLFHRLIAIVLFVFFTTVSAGNIVVSFATLYRSPEMNFLLSQPVPYSTIFTVKFLDNFFYSSGTLFLASFAVLLGYGTYFHLQWYFYPVYLLGVLMPCMLMAGSLAVIVLLLVMKLAAKVPFKALIACVAAAYVLQVIAYFTMTNPIALVREVMQYYPFVNAYYGAVDPPVARVLPNYWAAQVLYFWITDFTPGLLTHIALCVLGSLACFIGAVLLGGRYFYETWLTSLSIRPSEAKRSGGAPFFHFERASRLSPHAEAVLKKEYWLFFREPSQWIHASVLAALLLIFLASVGTMQFTVVTSDLRAVIYLVVFVFNAFLLSSIALRFAFPVMSLEGRAYWAVRSSPVRPSKIYWIKSGTIAALLAVLGTVIWFVSTIPYAAVPYVRLSSFMIIGGIALAAASLNTGMGALYADFGEKNPIRIASSQGATMTFLFSMALLVAVVALYFFPMVSIFVAHFGGLRPVQFSAIAAPVAAIVALCAVVSAASHWAGLRALRNDF